MSQTSDSCLDTWMGREALAEAMIPLIGRLYRENSVVTSIHGRSLINKSTMNILKAHRFARRMSKDELPLEETAPLLDALAQLDLGAGRHRHRPARTRSTRPKARRQAWRNSSARNSPRSWASAAATTAPAPTSCSTASAGSAGSWPAFSSNRPAAARACGCGPSWSGAARTTTSIKRASLLRRDSVHGPFEGTITVDRGRQHHPRQRRPDPGHLLGQPRHHRLHGLRHPRRPGGRQHRPLARRRGPVPAPAEQGRGPCPADRSGQGRPEEHRARHQPRRHHRGGLDRLRGLLHHQRHHPGAEGGQRRVRHRPRPRRDGALLHERPEPDRQLPQGRPPRPLGRAEHGDHRDRAPPRPSPRRCRNWRASSPATPSGSPPRTCPWPS